jgi:hypothetical protein
VLKAVQRGLIGAAALALPLTALGAAPAMANDRHNGADDPKINIKAVWVKRGDVKVKVGYKCDTDRRDSDTDRRDSDTDRRDRKRGEIEVKLRQHHVKYSGDKRVKCDGEWASTVITLDKDRGRLHRGHAKVKATITDPQDEEARDKEHVRIKRHNRH